MTPPAGHARVGRHHDLDLRRRFQVTALALKRDEEVRSNPPAGEPLAGGDVLVVMGSVEALAEVTPQFVAPREGRPAAES